MSDLDRWYKPDTQCKMCGGEPGVFDKCIDCGRDAQLFYGCDGGKCIECRGCLDLLKTCFCCKMPCILGDTLCQKCESEYNDKLYQELIDKE